jgi:hypothetical protein
VEQLDRQRRQWQVVDEAMRGIWKMVADPGAQPA